MKTLLKVTAASGLIALFALALTESAFGVSCGIIIVVAQNIRGLP